MPERETEFAHAIDPQSGCETATLPDARDQGDRPGPVPGLTVLHVFGTLDRGGSETAIMNLYRRINRDCLRFDFVCHRQAPWAFEEEIRALGGRIYVAPRYKVWNHRSYMRWWSCLFANHPEIAVVHGHVHGTAAMYLSAARSAGKTTIAHSHTTRHGGSLAVRAAKRLFSPRIVRSADYLFACGIEAGQFMFGTSACTSSRFRVIHNAIDVDVFTLNPQVRAAVRAELDVRDQILVGHVGRFDYSKNHEFLLEAFAALLQLEPTSSLLLVGDGPLRHATEQRAKSLGVSESVIFAGVRPDVHRLMQAMDVLVFPSRFEGLGVVLIEAQAAGLHALASSAVPAAAKVTPELEFLSLGEKPETWAARVQVLAHRSRRDTRTEIASAGYDVAQVAVELQHFYEQAISRDRGDRRNPSESTVSSR